MMKTPDEIKKGLECCSSTSCKWDNGCAYMVSNHCATDLKADALAYIQQLEAENKQYHQETTEMYSEMCMLREKVHRLEAERDAAVSELVGTCQVCRWEETAKCASCHFCEDAWNVHESNWEWRGVQKEE